MNPIDWASGVHAHLQIAKALMDEIAAGTYSPGDRLPDGKSLRRTFHVSHMTVSFAFKELREQGVAVYKPGRGMFVTDSSSKLSGEDDG